MDVDSLFHSPLSSESKLPLYHQLADQLREAVRQGAIPPDEPIPREVDLSESLGVSRGVVRQAILQLVQEGYLRRIPGRERSPSLLPLSTTFLVSTTLRRK